MSYEYDTLCVAKDLVKELRKNREVKEKLQAEEIAARDRVDISLVKYEKLVDENYSLRSLTESLNKEVYELQNILKKLGFPPKVLDNLDAMGDVMVIKYDDALGRRAKYKIEFDIDDKYLEEL